MRIGLCGWTLSGKSTVFDALTGASGGLHAGGVGKVRVGIAKVADPRIDVLAELYHPKKKTHATVEYVDLPGLVSDSRAHDANPGTLSDVRQAEALIAVVRAFDDFSIPTPFEVVDPVRDFSRLRDEILFADLEMADRRVKRLEVDVTKPTSHQQDDRLQLECLKRVKAALEEGTPISDLPLSDVEEKAMRGFHFLTGKPILVLVNRGEQSIGEPCPYGKEDFGEATMEIFAKLELELNQLDEADRDAFMKDMGISGLAAPEIIRRGYEILDQISFFTGGDKEVRAWTLRRGATALDAAGAIHSDFQRGFIRAEVMEFEAFKAFGGSFKEARSQGKLRLEGKDYVVQDGDVIEFRFSV